MHRVCGNPDFSRSPIFVSIRARIRIRGYNYYTSSFLPSDSKLPLHLSFLPQLQRRDDVVVVVVVVRWPDFAVRWTCLRRNWKYVAITVKLEFSLRCGSIAISKISPPTKGSFASIPHTYIRTYTPLSPGHRLLKISRLYIFWLLVHGFFFFFFNIRGYNSVTVLYVLYPLLRRVLFFLFLEKILGRRGMLYKFQSHFVG